MSTDAILNQGELDVILTAHATKVNRTEPNLTEPQTCLACRNHALNAGTTIVLTARLQTRYKSLSRFAQNHVQLSVFEIRLLKLR